MSKIRQAQEVIEIVGTFSDRAAEVAQDVIEIVQAFTAGAAPAGSFGVATSQRVMEMVMGAAVPARLGQYVVEMVVSETETSGSGSGGGTVGFGYAV